MRAATSGDGWPLHQPGPMDIRPTLTGPGERLRAGGGGCRWLGAASSAHPGVGTWALRPRACGWGKVGVWAVGGPRGSREDCSVIKAHTCREGRGSLGLGRLGSPWVGSQGQGSAPPPRALAAFLGLLAHPVLA